MALRDRAGRIRLAAAVAAVVILLRPFPTRSEAEAGWDAVRRAEVVAQLRAGTFPAYVGQGEAVADGTPLAGAPVRPAVGAAVHFLTFGKAAPATVERAFAVLCALGGLWAAYYGSRSVLRDHRRVRFLLAAGYGAGCAWLWQRGRCSEAAFAAVPLVPLLFSELVRGVGRPDFRSAAGAAGALALVWMAHPPTGLTATAVAAVGVACWRSPRAAVWAGGLFALLSAWFFAGAGPLGVLPIRAAWLTDQCALPAAAGCAVAALVLRKLMAADRWEFALEVESAAGEREAVFALRPLTTLGVLAVCGLAFAGLNAGRAPDPATARPEPVALLPVSPNAAASARPVHTLDAVLNNHLTQAGASVWNEALVPFKPDGAVAADQPERVPDRYVPVHALDGLPVVRCVVRPGRNVLTLQYWTRNYNGVLHVAGDTVRQSLPLPHDSDGVRGLRLAIVSAAAEPEVVEVSVAGKQTSVEPNSGVYLAPLGLNAYRPDDLPVRVTSLHPYTAGVRVDAADGLLTTHRRFVPGYEARVNRQRVPVLASADGRAAVRVPNGASEVRLRYRGIAPMRVGFAVSALTALGLAGAAAWRAGRRSSRAASAPAAPAVPSVPLSRAA